ncbi:hypothetical protein F5Y18DRAFT_435158 [Xylariaceae sp. FL1019]|nr:hypothetical protein F5Y18DRAFT_435158 [Xylariaceae sp. FL1019]
MAALKIEDVEHQPAATQTGAPQSQDTPQSLPGPSMATGKGFFRETDSQNIHFRFCPEPSKASSHLEQTWAVEMAVKCHDVPLQMREGFHWDASNVVREDGYISSNANRLIHVSGKQYYGSRYYFLKDMRESPRWVACIAVYALNWETIYRFDLSQLSLNTMHGATAYAPHGDPIYNYLYGKPTACYNVIYDDMPMEGWWPWPKKGLGDVETDEAGLAGSEKLSLI